MATEASRSFVTFEPLGVILGGVKHSGYGRELSECGIKEFVNIKTVYVAGASTGLQDPGSE
jgi:acyl-CoA reductase-like NAD-dependent aldehyde dehydrogenase